MKSLFFSRLLPAFILAFFLSIISGFAQITDCPNCTVTAIEGDCVLGRDGILRRSVTFTPTCTLPAPTFYSYNLQGGIMYTGSNSGTGAPVAITVWYQNSPTAAPTLTIYGPNNCPSLVITIPYIFTRCPQDDTPCPIRISNLTISAVGPCVSIGNALGHNVTIIPTLTGGSPTSYIWSFSHGAPAVITGSGAPGPITHFYPTTSGGPYSVTLTIIGSNGQICGTLTLLIPLSPCACEPCATISNITVKTPTNCSQVVNGYWPVTFTATYTGCPPTLFLWNFGDGSPTQTTTTPQVQHNYYCPHAAPPYFITLNLIGCEGNPAYVSPSMSVPFSLIACGCPTIDDVLVNNSGCNVDVDAIISGFCPSAITQYIWDFGDGTPTVTLNAPNTQASHTYTTCGDYWVTLTLGGVGSGCSFSKKIHVDCGCEDCFNWSLAKWYCWVFVILFGLSLIALVIFLVLALQSNTWQSWLLALGIFVMTLLWAILLVTLCNCCFALWALYWLLLIFTIVALIMALNDDAYWGGFFSILVLTVIVAVLLYCLCGSCQALWYLFILFLILFLLFVGWALCILSGNTQAPNNFWLKFIIIAALLIIILIVYYKLCGATICDFLQALAASVTTMAVYLALIDQKFRPCSNWLTGYTNIPTNSPIFNVPNTAIFSFFIWLIWYIVCNLFN